MAVASWAQNWSPLSDSRVDGHPQRDKAIHQDVGGSLSCEFSGGDNEHVRPPAEAVREEEDVRISSSCDRQGPKAINANGYSGAVGQGDG